MGVRGVIDKSTWDSGVCIPLFILSAYGCGVCLFNLVGITLRAVLYAVCAPHPHPLLPRAGALDSAAPRTKDQGSEQPRPLSSSCQESAPGRNRGLRAQALKKSFFRGIGSCWCSWHEPLCGGTGRGTPLAGRSTDISIPWCCRRLTAAFCCAAWMGALRSCPPEQWRF